MHHPDDPDPCWTKFLNERDYIDHTRGWFISCWAKALYLPILPRPVRKQILSINIRQVSRLLHHISRPILFGLLAREIRDGKDFHLHRAVSLGLGGAVEALLEAGSPLSKANQRDETALHVAARENSTDGVDSISRAGAAIDCLNSLEWSPLHLAARYGYDEVIEKLIARGADYNLHGFHGWAPLHHAACSRSFETVKLLLRIGSDRQIRDNSRQTASQLALAFHQFKLARLLGPSGIT